MALYFKDIEITNIDNLVPQTGLGITDLWFSSTNVYTVWQTYEGTLPATINANGDDMRQYQIYGNTGGVGDRTVNFFNGYFEQGTTAGGIPTESSNRVRSNIVVAVAGAFSVDFKNKENFDIAFDFWNNSVLVEATSWLSTKNYITPNNATSVRIKIRKSNDAPVTPAEVIDFGMYSGSTPPASFVPFGYEVDIVSRATICIGNDPLCGIGTYTDSLDLSTGILTRRIGKYVFTGEENITRSQPSLTVTRMYYVIQSARASSPLYCTHFSQTSVETSYPPVGQCNFNSISNFIMGVDGSQFETATAFKSYLAQQYANGTPVTVWYVLAEPEVSTITVPSGLTGTIEGYLIQDGTPTPETPIYPTANGVKQADGTYIIDYGTTITTPIYIGDEPLDKVSYYSDYVDYEAQKVVRAIKKYVLTGDENWEEISGTFASRTYFRWVFAPINYCVRHVCTCSHFTQATITTATTTVGFDVFDSTSVNGEVLAIRPDNVQTTTLADFKAWLAAQYAAGTPVTVWCALTTAEETDPPVPLPALPTCDGTTIVDYSGQSVAPEKVLLKYRKEGF